MPETSSPSSRPLPEGVTEDDLYDGPENVVALKPPAAAELVAPIPSDDPMEYQSVSRPSVPMKARIQEREVSSVAELKKSYPAVLTAALDVLSARLLGLLAVIAACLIWGFAIYDPLPLRIAAASLFSVTVLLPLIVLYWKAGVTGDGG